MSTGQTARRTSELTPDISAGQQLATALDRLEKLVVDGLRHGFFEFSIACEIVAGGKRRLVIRAGKSHQFTIPEEDLPREAGWRVIPEMGTSTQESQVASHRWESEAADQRRGGARSQP